MLLNFHGVLCANGRHTQCRTHLQVLLRHFIFDWFNIESLNLSTRSLFLFLPHQVVIVTIFDNFDLVRWNYLWLQSHQKSLSLQVVLFIRHFIIKYFSTSIDTLLRHPVTPSTERFTWRVTTTCWFINLVLIQSGHGQSSANKNQRLVCTTSSSRII